MSLAKATAKYQMGSVTKLSMIIIMPKPLRDATAAHSSEHPSNALSAGAAQFQTSTA